MTKDQRALFLLEVGHPVSLLTFLIVQRESPMTETTERESTARSEVLYNSFNLTLENH